VESKLAGLILREAIAVDGDRECGRFRANLLEQCLSPARRHAVEIEKYRVEPFVDRKVLGRKPSDDGTE
jgi:hypothetical protein